MSTESFYTDICVFCSCFLVVIVIIVLKLRFQMWMLIFSVFHWLLLIISGNLSLSLWPVTLWPSCLTLPVFLPCSLSLTRMSFWPVCLSLWPVWLSLYLSLTLTFLVPTCPSFWLVSLSLPPSDLFVSLNWLSLSPPISLYLSVSLSCVYLHLSPWPFFSLCLSLWAFSLLLHPSFWTVPACFSVSCHVESSCCTGRYFVPALSRSLFKFILFLVF